MVNLDNRGRRSLRRGLAVAGCLLLVASAAGAAAVTSRLVAQTHVLSGDQPATTTTVVLSLPETEPSPSVPTTTTPAPAAPVTVPGTVPHMPTTTTAVATSAPRPPSPAETGRPPCAGDPWGTYGYGCTVSRTELPMRVEWSAYGQLLQANRDPVQVSLTVKDIEGGLPHAWHIDYGDGTGSDGDPTRYTCGQQIPPFTDSGRHIYS
ncbi:MAG TPA: hypothetical protein VHM89_08040 [Acidimicrobiales bacterium]|nr:hypothetical protein [Acidimicrobiales bacterium]